MTVKVVMFMKQKIRHIVRYVKSMLMYRQGFKHFVQRSGERFLVLKKDRYPCIQDRYAKTSFDKHYTYHTAWAARKLKQISPESHTDISSLTYFSTLVSAFIPVNFYDYRPETINISDFSIAHCDLLDLPFQSNSLTSLSCMHVLEHIGLGRYGDPLDYEGDLKALFELKRVIAKNGDFLFVVPIGGVAKVVFNAHRIYTYQQIIAMFDGFELKEFSLIPDMTEGGIVLNAPPSLADQQNYGCGCFWFKKL